VPGRILSQAKSVRKSLQNLTSLDAKHKRKVTACEKGVPLSKAVFIADRQLYKVVKAIDPLKSGWIYSCNLASEVDRINAICLKMLKIRKLKSLEAKVLYLNFISNAIFGHRESNGLSSRRTTRLVPSRTRILPGIMLTNIP